MGDRFNPQDLHNKGFEPDGKGGYRKVRPAKEPEVKDISAELAANKRPVPIEQFVKELIDNPPPKPDYDGLLSRCIGYKPGDERIGLGKSDMQVAGTYVDLMNIYSFQMENAIEDARKYIEWLPEEKKGAALAELLTTGITFLPSNEVIKVKYRFDINPAPAPRMVSSDKWKTDPNDPDPERRQRKRVTQYFAFRDKFLLQALDNGFKLGETLRVLFIFPMPQYYSKAKRASRLMQPHKQRPDADNCAKSILDAFGLDDGYVWDIRAVKLWGNKGEIIIF